MCAVPQSRGRSADHNLLTPTQRGHERSHFALTVLSGATARSSCYLLGKEGLERTEKYCQKLFSISIAAGALYLRRLLSSSTVKKP
jgi:hypothetical protein